MSKGHKLTYGRFEDAMKRYADSKPLGSDLYFIEVKINLTGDSVNVTEKAFNKHRDKFFLDNPDFVLDGGNQDIFYKESSSTGTRHSIKNSG